MGRQSGTTDSGKLADSGVANRCRTTEGAQATALTAACAVMQAAGGGPRIAVVRLGTGSAGRVLAPERLAWLEGHYRLYLEVLDRGSPDRQACVRITRPPDAGSLARRCADAVGHLLSWLVLRVGRPATS